MFAIVQLKASQINMYVVFPVNILNYDCNAFAA